MDVNSLLNRQLVGGFLIVEIELADEQIADPLGREAAAQTRITGRNFKLTIQSDLSNDEISITLYHEILEAATVACADPPESVFDLTEDGFESAAREALYIWGEASIESLNRMLQFYGFGEK